MNSLRNFTGGLVGACLLLQVAAAQFEPLVKWIPETANSVVVVRSADIFKSDLARQENWLQEYEKAYGAGLEFLPTSIERYIIASQVDYQFLQPLWTVSVYEKKGEPINLTEVTDRLGGNLDLLSGYDAINLRSDAFLVKLQPNLAASMAPANRQYTIRWLQSQARSTPILTDYLNQAIKLAESDAQITVAFDLQDVLKTEDVRKELTGFECVNEAECDLAIGVLSALRGATLGVKVGGQVTGFINLDFSKNPSAIKAKAKEILLEALALQGLLVDDFEKWDLTHSGNQFRLAGPLSAEGLRTINLLIQHPLEEVMGYGGSRSATSGVTEQDTGTVSKKYFDSINNVLAEYRRKPEMKSLNSYATWFDLHARKIDALPVVGVDGELITFAQYVTDRFREMSVVMRSAELAKTERATSFQNYSYSYRYGRWGGYGEYWDNSKNRATAASVERLRGKNAAREILEEVEDKAGHIRQEMSKKYGINF
jgi:hypothetical protein